MDHAIKRTLTNQLYLSPTQDSKIMSTTLFFFVFLAVLVTALYFAHRKNWMPAISDFFVWCGGGTPLIFNEVITANSNTNVPLLKEKNTTALHGFLLILTTLGEFMLAVLMAQAIGFGGGVAFVYALMYATLCFAFGRGILMLHLRGGRTWILFVFAFVLATTVGLLNGFAVKHYAFHRQLVAYQTQVREAEIAAVNADEQAALTTANQPLQTIDNDIAALESDVATAESTRQEQVQQQQARIAELQSKYDDEKDEASKREIARRIREAQRGMRDQSSDTRIDLLEAKRTQRETIAEEVAMEKERITSNHSAQRDAITEKWSNRDDFMSLLNAHFGLMANDFAFAFVSLVVQILFLLLSLAAVILHLSARFPEYRKLVTPTPSP